MARVWAWMCLMVSLTIESAVAYQFTVGGSKGWTVPSGSDKETYNQWSSRNRFQIGDTILFKYDKRVDSVLQVSQASYNTCNTSGPVASHTDGNTMLQFPVHGPFYFISGNQSRCQLGEKLLVVVLAPTSVSPTPAVSPTSPNLLSPSTTAAAPAPAPATSTSPTMASPSPSPSASMPSPALSPSSSFPSPITAPSPSPSLPSSPTPDQVAASPPVPATAGGSIPPSASFPPPNTSPSISPESSSAAFSKFQNLLIPIFFVALLSVRIATV